MGSVGQPSASGCCLSASGRTVGSGSSDRLRSCSRPRLWPRCSLARTVGRYAVGSLYNRTRLAALRQMGVGPDRVEIEAAHQVERTRTVERTREFSLTNYYKGAPPEMQNLFRVAGMDPEHALIRSGRTRRS